MWFHVGRYIAEGPDGKVGISQLKRDASAILKRVRDHNAMFEVTYREETMARIVPLMSEEERLRLLESWWAGTDKLAEEISARWPKGVSAAETVREVRCQL